PGGTIYAHFGPVWSAPDGSHIESLVVEGLRYDFWTHTLLPSWSHLVFREEELASLLAIVHPPSLAEALSSYVHHSRWINRLTWADHRRYLERCGLDIVLLNACTEFGY